MTDDQPSEKANAAFRKIWSELGNGVHISEVVVRGLDRFAAEAVAEEREWLYGFVNRCWTFDNGQMHTHSWHDKQDCLEVIRKRGGKTDAD